MEIECLLAHGLDRVLKEFTITKSDSDGPKKDLIKQTVTTGKYHMEISENDSISSTKTVINQYVEAIKD